MKLVDYYSLCLHWFHCISNNTCNTGFLKTRILEDYRIDTGGDTDLGSNTSKVISIPSAPLFPFIGSDMCQQMILCRLLRQE